eukprot:CAMPEP_0113590468 /NCGR_PEP_ID=MMETSP0015_2-20120614/36700_1 /TAXON_ID=2838 /ORGANISM="Odontella" /LENGTH=159 /DNA_ID=CAMNT_0000496681 /DNA_START=644 /DNA_END=1121 /DNA_ORIENTATION=+ /assembly_acc=CAM_ASM_000160
MSFCIWKEFLTLAEAPATSSRSTPSGQEGSTVGFVVISGVLTTQGMDDEGDGEGTGEASAVNAVAAVSGERGGENVGDEALGAVRSSLKSIMIESSPSPPLPSSLAVSMVATAAASSWRAWEASRHLNEDRARVTPDLAPLPPVKLPPSAVPAIAFPPS